MYFYTSIFVEVRKVPNWLIYIARSSLGYLWVGNAIYVYLVHHKFIYEVNETCYIFVKFVALVRLLGYNFL